MPSVSTTYRVLQAGDCALVFEFGNQVDRLLNNLVLELAEQLRQTALAGVREIVPTFRSVMVEYDPLLVSADQIASRTAEIVSRLEPTRRVGRAWTLPTCYDPSLGMDLLDVARACSLSSADIVELHVSAAYHVYMLGFLPGQAYLGELASELQLPRRKVPRTSVPKGSVGIAGPMTCLFPLESPCGWHIIGRSPVALWTNMNGALLLPGDTVQFQPISLEEYKSTRVEWQTQELLPLTKTAAA
jgi:inhibitor of KinA